MVSIASDRKKVQFAQQNPRFVCKRASFFKAKSAEKGYVCKCRDPRCSLACNRNWSNKMGACLARHLTHVREAGYDVYRGNLMVPAGATPEDHKAARAAFLLSIKRWAKRRAYRVELQGMVHVTDMANAHWDVVLWTDAPRTPLHDHFGRTWKQCGGYRQSLVVPDDLDAAAHYQAKPGQVLLAHQSVCGLDCQWATRGFWNGSSLEAVWAELIEEWKPCPTVKTDITDTPKSNSEPKPSVYVPGESEHWDRVNFLRKLPASPDLAVGLSTYSQRWGVTPEYMASILERLPGVVKTNGQLIDGQCSYGAFFAEAVSHSKD